MAIHFLSAVDGWQHGRHFLGLEKKKKIFDSDADSADVAH